MSPWHGQAQCTELRPETGVQRACDPRKDLGLKGAEHWRTG